jgi:D-3-phosphoglycerate dehydrogenase
MPDHGTSSRPRSQPVVVGLGSVDPALVAGVLGGRCRFIAAQAGVGVDLADVTAATARVIPMVVTPGAGSAAVAEGAIGMALHLVKRFGPLTDLVRDVRWAERTTCAAATWPNSVAARPTSCISARTRSGLSW